MIRVVKDINNKKICSGEIECAVDSVFDRAKDYYRSHESDRNNIVKARTDKNILIYLEYVKNQATSLYWVDDFWEYDIFDDRIDIDILCRASCFLIEEIEEYSKAICDIILHYLPNCDIYSFDPLAGIIYGNDRVKVVLGWADLYSRFPQTIKQEMMVLKTDINPCDPNPWKKHYSSLSLMCSVFWMCRTISYGNKNDNIAILLFRYRLLSSGMVDMIKFPVFAIIACQNKTFLGKKIIPFIDFSVQDDNNSFVETFEEDAWTTYFEQVSNLSRDDVYESQNVILIDHKLNWYNLYIMEVRNYAILGDYLRKYIRFNSMTKTIVSERIASLWPDNKRILGVKARGTDYLRCWKNGNHICPASPNELLREVQELLNKEKYDYVFLATEDADYYNAFIKSDLKEVIIAANSFRTSGKHNNIPIMNSLKENISDLYSQNCLYLSEILILSKCNSLIANTDCGSVLLAKSIKKGDYENFIIVSGME